MDTKIGGPYRPETRQAESTDTRQAIGRHERDEERRRPRQEKPRTNDEALWQDSTVVSIAALCAFLENLTGAAPAPGQAAPYPSADDAQTENPHAHHENSRAASAYQTAQSRGAPKPAAHASAPPAGASSALSEDERQRIAKLLIRLRLLESRDIKELTILRSDKFLDSLEVAARAASL